MLVSEQLSTYPSPKPTLNLNLLSVDCCWFKGRGRCAFAEILTLLQPFDQTDEKLCNKSFEFYVKTNLEAVEGLVSD